MGLLRRSAPRNDTIKEEIASPPPMFRGTRNDATKRWVLLRPPDVSGESQ